MDLVAASGILGNPPVEGMSSTLWVLQLSSFGQPGISYLQHEDDGPTQSNESDRVKQGSEGGIWGAVKAAAVLELQLFLDS